MMKEKTCVYIGIILILALLCCSAMFYGVTGVELDRAAVMESAVSSPISRLLSDAPGAQAAESLPLAALHSVA